MNTIRFWFRQLQFLLFTVFGATLILYVIYVRLLGITIIEVQGATQGISLSSGCCHLLLICFFLPMIYSVMMGVLFFPVVLSLGCTRRNLILSTYTTLGLVQLLYLGLSGVVWTLQPDAYGSAGLARLPMFFAVFLCFSACNQFFGILNYRNKVLGLVLFMILNVPAAIAASFLLYGNHYQLLPTMGWIAIGCAAYALFCLFSCLVMGKTEVHL